MIHVQLNGVSRTLVMTLRARANEHTRQGALFADDWSYNWYQWMPDYPDYNEWYNTTFELASNIRTQIIDEITQKFIEEHQHPIIVELGGGLSSRPYRVGIDRAEWVILDLPEAIHLRRKVDAQNDQLLFISDSASNDNWYKRIPKTDNDDYLFIAEGVLMFMEPDAVEALFQNLRGTYYGATVVFDSPREQYVEREKENFSKMEADIQFYIDEHDLKSLGVNKENVRYLLTEYPERWEELDVSSSALTKQNSGFVATARLTKP